VKRESARPSLGEEREVIASWFDDARREKRTTFAMKRKEGTSSLSKKKKI